MSVTIVLVYLLIGACAGTLSGLLGIGGGIVVVPALAMTFEATGMPEAYVMHMAAATSLATMIFTTYATARAYQREHLIDWQLFRRFLPGLLVGTVMGALLTHTLSTHVLKLLFVPLLLMVAGKMFHMSTIQVRQALPTSWRLRLASIILGLPSGLFGIGAGTVGVPYLASCGEPIKQTSGTVSALTLPVAFIGAVTFILTGLQVTGLPARTWGYVYWPAMSAVAITSMVFAPLGLQLEKHLQSKLIKRIFSVFLLVLAIHFLMAFYHVTVPTL